MKILLNSLAAAAVIALSLTSINAAVLASTNFDGRVVAAAPNTNTATNLNWTTNGVSDPGNLAAFQWGGAAQALFDTSALAKGMFVPGLNVGNGGNDDVRSWTTTVVSGSSFTLETASFDYWAINGSQP